MRSASPNQVPQAVCKYLAGGEAVTKPSLYKYVAERQKLDRAHQAGFSTVKAHEAYLYKKSCDEFEKMLGIGKYAKANP